MIDILNQPTARLDRSRAVTLLDPKVERRNRRWGSQPVGEETVDSAEPAPAARPAAELSNRSRHEPSRPDTAPQSGLDFREVSAGKAAVLAPALATPGAESIAPAASLDVPGSESGSPDSPNPPKLQPLSARPPRLRDKEAAVEEPELPTWTSSAMKSGPSPEKGKIRSPLRMAGFPEACVEQSVAAGSPPGRAAEAGFPKAAAGSGSAANQSLLAGKGAAAAHQEALPAASGAPTNPVRVVFKPCPRYPEEALRHRLQGDVLLDVEFRYSGALEVLGVRRGLGHGLNESAIDATRKMRFAPARRDGRPVDTQATLRIRFQLLG